MELPPETIWMSAEPQKTYRGEIFGFVQNTLEEKLNHRPERQILVDAHILPSISANPIAPSIAASLAAVQFQRIADGINSKLRRRPTREDLINTGVIRVKDPNVAPSLQRTQTHLQFQRHAITVGHKLHSRPSRSQLVEDHIIVHDKEFDVDPKVTDAILSLRRARTVSALEETIATKHSRGPIHPLDFVDLISTLDNELGTDEGDFQDVQHWEDDSFSEGDFDDDDDEDDSEGEYYSESDYDDDSRSSTSEISHWPPLPFDRRLSESSMPSSFSSTTSNSRRLSKVSDDNDIDS
eukprot:TRINITY_DN5315_c0_g1_i2.p2 TRINITY_DN5315_c0_g1~~TRINITY_DN5315_c0_g1_i2.p2  ORF type:complete len:295 (+),score=39.66 TRINITY_DN5315_c0_g1_i2:216-1100(+)